jgi:hypothetical protein
MLTKLQISTRYNAVSWSSDFCQIFPQIPGNGILETLNSNILREGMPPDPLDKRRTCGSRLVPSYIKRYIMGANMVDSPLASPEK